MRFGSLLVAASTAVLVVAAPSMEKKKRVSKFRWFGVNESGAEFGNTAIPGELGKDYTWPVEQVHDIALLTNKLIDWHRSSIDTLVAQGINIFRIHAFVTVCIRNC